MTNIHSIVKAAVRDLLDEVEPAAGSTTTFPAMLNPRPSLALKATYQTLFTLPTSRSMAEQIESRLTATQLAIAIVGATLSREVFTGDCVSALTFDTYSAERTAAFGKEVALLDVELRSQRTDFDTLLRRVYLRRVDTQAFRTGDVAPLATATAKYALSAMLKEHLQEDFKAAKETQSR